MDIYIDYANLKSYVASASNSNFNDCNRMLKNKFNIKFTFPKEQMISDPDIKQWMVIMMQGVNNNISFKVAHPTRPLKTQTYKDFDKSQLSAVYLLDDEKTATIRENGMFIFGEVGKEVDTISSLIVNQDYGFAKQLPIKKLKSWHDISPFLSPCSDIILVDQYLFCFEELYDKNVISLIGELSKNAKQAKMNIVILTSKECYDKRSKRTFTPNWDNIKAKIKKEVEKNTKVKPNLTFVLSKNLEEHDRSIFTNYKSIESGDTFTYFDNAGNIISNGRHLEIFSLAEMDYYDNSRVFIEDMQKIINRESKRNSSNIIGDKISNYLDFS